MPGVAILVVAVGSPTITTSTCARFREGPRDMNNEAASALATDQVIDITTTGRQTGQPRRIEIWFHRVDGKYFISQVASLCPNSDRTAAIQPRQANYSNMVPVPVRALCNAYMGVMSVFLDGMS